MIGVTGVIGVASAYKWDNTVSNKGTPPGPPKSRKIEHVLPSHRKQVLCEGDATMPLRSIGLDLMSDWSPGFDDVCTVNGGDGETPVESTSDAASARSDYCSSE